MTQVLTPVADRFGTYRLIMGAAAFKLAAGVLIWLAGRRAWPVWALLFLGNRLAATAWGFYNLSFSDVSCCCCCCFRGLHAWLPNTFNQVELGGCWLETLGDVSFVRSLGPCVEPTPAI